MNSINIIGRLTDNPQVRYIPGKDTAVCTFTIAVDDSYKKDTAHFFDCKAFGKTGELIAEHFQKGKAIALTGEINQERWETENGKRSKMVIKVDRLTFLPREKQSSEPSGGGGFDSDSDIPF